MQKVRLQHAKWLKTLAYNSDAIWWDQAAKTLNHAKPNTYIHLNISNLMVKLRNLIKESTEVHLNSESSSRGGKDKLVSILSEINGQWEQSLSLFWFCNA